MVPMATEARIVERDGKRRWECPACGKVLAEVTALAIVIKHDWRTVAIAEAVNVQQFCKCKQASYVDAEVLAR